MAFAQKDTLFVDWNKAVKISKTTATLQLVDNPMDALRHPFTKKYLMP